MCASLIQASDGIEGHLLSPCGYCKAYKLHVAELLLQELSILETLPFDRRVVQLYGSCTQGTNIQLVLEYMQVTISQCKYLCLPN